LASSARHLTAATLADCPETDAVWGCLPPVLPILLLPYSVTRERCDGEESFSASLPESFKASVWKIDDFTIKPDRASVVPFDWV
jgi:hypothetical protein